MKNPVEEQGEEPERERFANLDMTRAVKKGDDRAREDIAPIVRGVSSGAAELFLNKVTGGVYGAIRKQHKNRASALAAANQERFNNNMEDALHACEEELTRCKSDIAALRASEEKLTEFMRVIQEAGRHPEAEVRRALGTLAARRLLDDADSIDAFELAEVLPTLTAADLATLRAIDYLFRHGQTMGVRDEELVYNKCMPEDVKGVGHPNHLSRFMRRHGYGNYDELRIQHVVERLGGKHLTINAHRKKNAGRPSGFGIRLLDRIGREHPGSTPPEWPLPE